MFSEARIRTEICSQRWNKCGMRLLVWDMRNESGVQRDPIDEIRPLPTQML